MKQATGAPLRMDNGGPGHSVPSYSEFGTLGLATRFASAHQFLASRGRRTIQLFAKCRTGHPRRPEPVRVASPAPEARRSGSGAQDAPGNRVKRAPAHTVPMPSRKFGIGEMVALKASVSPNLPGEVYEVVRLLPHNRREFECHIKSSNESHLRVAGEGELVRA
jgi:hypothetical protein